MIFLFKIMYRGYVKLWRKMQEKGWYKNSKYAHLWVHILIKANHKNNEFMWNNETVIIEDGQFITGRKELSKETGIAESTIERILKMFEKEHQIEQRKTKKFRIISVINWKKYQQDEQQRGRQVDNKQTPEEQQVSTNKNDKNEKNDKNDKKSGDLAVAGVEDIMNIFYLVNPTLNWGNKTIRKAAADLIKKFGLEEVKNMAEAAVSIQGEEFAPTITNPWELREKLAKVKLFFDRQKNNNPKIVKV